MARVPECPATGEGCDRRECSVKFCSIESQGRATSKKIASAKAEAEEASFLAHREQVAKDILRNAKKPCTKANIAKVAQLPRVIKEARRRSKVKL